ncbi:unnamed protein product [Anisakis simplex]|uniref:G_PROTEIN_RECEP_F1_2 domain-containing protein n=1 Tax=Anisakis simplex TaxID=6269 RepID=A0A0M3J124_ANISI|nr:unnamed protein product [Anisakis simplex]
MILIQGQPSLSAFEQRQRRLTKSTGISCLFTVLLYVLPICLYSAFGSSSNQQLVNILAVYTGISTNLIPLSNIFVLTTKHTDIKEQLLRMIPFHFNKSAVHHQIPLSQQGFFKRLSVSTQSSTMWRKTQPRNFPP